jgi:hypothetical protein
MSFIQDKNKDKAIEKHRNKDIVRDRPAFGRKKI